MRRLMLGAGAAVLAAVVVLVLVLAGRADQPERPAAAPPTSAPPTSALPLTSERLRAAVGAPGIRTHLEALQRIAAANGGNRAAGTPGYDASVGYVSEQLRAAGYSPRVERFDVPVFAARGAPVLEAAGEPGGLRAGSDYDLLEFSGSGDARARLRAVDLAVPPGPAGSTSGCERQDFAALKAGEVALLQRGTCPFGTKVQNAFLSGASAALVFNEGRPASRDLVRGTLGGPASIPALALSYDAGVRLAALAGRGGSVHVRAETVSERRPTSNVTVETPGGRADRVVMVGAHLDSVPDGPGINDNGSGAATVLELAKAVAGTTSANKLRFAWWGGEELGLLGSRHYVAGLSPAEVGRIALYLNLDMVASPNFARFVYAAAGEPPGSAPIERVLREWFASQRLAARTVDFGDRSDHAPFRERGVPVGGLFTGAEATKGAEEAAGAGGSAGDAYDPCYHKPCDDLDNVALPALDQLGDAAAHALATFAASTADVDKARRR